MWITGLIVCFGWIFSLCFHEFAHALVAYWGGDTSVKDKGYLTFNPIKYTEPGFSLIMPLVFILIGGLALPGGAVYINSNLLRNRWWSSLVSAAGPFASLLFALFLMIPFWIVNSNIEDKLSNLYFYSTNSLLNIVFPSLAFLIYLEIFAVIFNLLPIPPFDGYGILQPWLPAKINQILKRYSNYSYYFIFGLFIFSPKLSSIFFGGIKDICIFLGVSSQTIQLGQNFFYQPINKGIAIAIIILVAYALRLNEHTWYQKGNHLARQEQDELAIKAYEKAISLKANYADAWLEKGHALHRLNKYAKAINAYQKTIKIDSNNDEAWLYLGNIYFNSQDYEQAIKIYQGTIKVNPNCYQALFYLGNIYFNSQDYEQSINFYRKTININPDMNEAWLNLIWSLFNLEKKEEAKVILEKEIIIQADRQYKSKQYEQVIKLCQEMIKAFPYDNNLWFYIDNSIKKLEHSKGQKYIFHDIIDQHLAAKKANYLFKIEEYQNVVDFCREVKNFYHKNTNILYYLAISLDKLAKYEEAQDIFEQIIAFNPDNIVVLSGYAGHYYVQQDYIKSINNFQKVTKIEPENSTAWYNMACCYSLQKESQKAIASLQQAIKINPQVSRDLAQKDQDFAFIQNEPEFRNLVWKKDEKLG